MPGCFHNIPAAVAVVAVLAAGAARADLREIRLLTDKSEPVRAIVAAPAGPPGRRPAVIFNHGTEVRQDGYEGALNRGGMDIGQFLRALARENYVAIAPIRSILAGEVGFQRGRMIGTPEQWTEVIAFGIRAAAAARRHAAERPDVDPQRIAVMGFSEGGNVSLWAASQAPGYRAVVLLSPAAISQSLDYRLGQAARVENVARIGAPVFLAVGADDLPAVRGGVEKFLIPNLTQTNPKFRHRTDYPGDHKWFWQVRDEYWKDVTAFLKEHLD